MEGYLYSVRYYIEEDHQHKHSDLIKLIRAKFKEEAIKIEHATWLIHTHYLTISLNNELTTMIESVLEIPRNKYRMFIGRIPKRISYRAFHWPSEYEEWIDERVTAA